MLYLSKIGFFFVGILDMYNLFLLYFIKINRNLTQDSLLKVP